MGNVNGTRFHRVILLTHTVIVNTLQQNRVLRDTDLRRAFTPTLEAKRSGEPGPIMMGPFRHGTWL